MDADMREAVDEESREAGGGGEGQRRWAQGEDPQIRASVSTGCGGVGLHDDPSIGGSGGEETDGIGIILDISRYTHNRGGE
jgi:hypothetical protein